MLVKVLKSHYKEHVINKQNISHQDSISSLLPNEKANLGRCHL